MPLTSKNNGPELAPGDIVRMDWVIARTYPARFNVVAVYRESFYLGGHCACPPTTTVATRVTTRPTGVTMIDGLPMVEGNACTLLWTVAQVFPESGVARVMREGLTHAPGQPGHSLVGLVPVTITTGVRTSELELVAPEALASATRDSPWRRMTREDEVLLAEIEPAMLPFAFDPAGVAAPKAHATVSTR